MSIPTKKVSLIKAATHVAKVKQQESLFDKHDKDRDGFLSRKEVFNYAKAEMGVNLPLAAHDVLWESLTSGSTNKGIKKTDHMLMRAHIGIHKEKEIDTKLREARLAIERNAREEREAAEKKVRDAQETYENNISELNAGITAKKEALDAVVKETQASLKALEMEAVKAFMTLPKTPAAVVAAAVEKFQQDLDALREATAGAQKSHASIMEGSEADDFPKEVVSFAKTTAAAFPARLTALEKGEKSAATRVTNLKTAVVRRERDELGRFEKVLLDSLRKHRVVKSLSSAALFEELDADNDGRLEERDLVAFMQRYAEADAPATADAEAAAAVTPVLAEAEISRIFDLLDEEENGYLRKEQFVGLCRFCLRVVQDTVSTKQLDIKAGIVRRLEAGELVEILEGPVVVESIGLERVRVRFLVDNEEGWVTQKSSTGRSLLEEVPECKVLRAISLTRDCKLDSEKPLKGVTERMLKEGEAVEVLQWGPKDASAAGLDRIKVKAASDGAIGWTTMRGSAGSPFLEPQIKAAPAAAALATAARPKKMAAGA